MSSNVAEGRLNQKDPWKAAEYEGCMGRWGVRYIVCDIIVIVVLTMCNLTISSILQKPNKTPTECTHTLVCVVLKGLNAYISLRGDEGVKRIH